MIAPILSAPTATDLPPFGTAIGMMQAATASQSLAAYSQSQILARITGGLFLVTFATSIPALILCYAPALSDPAFILGGRFDTGVSMGALLELILIVANIGTALTLYPILRKYNEALSLGYVAARPTVLLWQRWTRPVRIRGCAWPIRSALFRRAAWFACRGAASPNRPFVLAAAFSVLQCRWCGTKGTLYAAGIAIRLIYC
jgi:Domain of unknown function (DUF4386)